MTKKKRKTTLRFLQAFVGGSALVPWCDTCRVEGRLVRALRVYAQADGTSLTLCRACTRKLAADGLIDLPDAPVYKPWPDTDLSLDEPVEAKPPAPEPEPKPAEELPQEAELP